MRQKSWNRSSWKNTDMELTRETAEATLNWALKQNPGPWGDHSRYAAKACEWIAGHCGMDSEQAYLLGLIHDIGRYPGVTGIRHMYDGYMFCRNMGWNKAAEICLTHGYLIQEDPEAIIGIRDLTVEEQRAVEQIISQTVYDDYILLAQLCDALAMPFGFCLLEKRWIDVVMRHGPHPANVRRWKRTLEIKAMFEARMGCSVYEVLPGVVENTFR